MKANATCSYNTIEMQMPFVTVEGIKIDKGLFLIDFLIGAGIEIEDIDICVIEVVGNGKVGLQ